METIAHWISHITGACGETWHPSLISAGSVGVIITATYDRSSGSGFYGYFKSNHRIRN